MNKEESNKKEDKDMADKLQDMLFGWGLYLQYKECIDHLLQLYEVWCEEKVSIRLFREYLAADPDLVRASFKLMHVAHEYDSTIAQATIKAAIDNMIHSAIGSRCRELDKLGNFPIYTLSVDKKTFRLEVVGYHWTMVDTQGRFLLVKTGNYFLSKEHAQAAIARALEE